MKRHLATLLIVLAASVGVPAEPTTYRGHVHLSEEASVETMIIATTQDLVAFQQRIPKLRVSKKNPAPPSDDKLLKLKTLTKPLAVILRPANLSFHPVLVRTRLRKGTLEVHYRLPTEEVEARVYGMGTYLAIELDQPFTSVRFLEKP